MSKPSTPRPETLETQVFNRYGEAFPEYAWTDARTAVDLFAAEVATLRTEKDRLERQNEVLLEALRGIAEMPEYDHDDAHRLRGKAARALTTRPGAGEGEDDAE